MAPSASRRPRPMTITWSQTASTSGSRWEETSRLMPLLWARSRASSRTSTRPAGSMPLVGSSRMTSLGSWTMAAAILRRCFMPGGVGLDLAVAGLAQADVVEDFVGALHAVDPGHAGELAGVGDELDAVDAGEQAFILGDEADGLADVEAAGG